MRLDLQQNKPSKALSTMVRTHIGFRELNLLIQTNKQKQTKKRSQSVHNSYSYKQTTTKTQKHDLKVYTESLPPKPSHGWGSTVHQGATIRKDGAASEVSASTVRVEMEAVTTALHRMAPRSDSQSTHAIVLTVPMHDLVKNWGKRNGHPRVACPRVACSTVPPPFSNTDMLPGYHK